MLNPAEPKPGIDTGTTANPPDEANPPPMSDAVPTRAAERPMQIFRLDQFLALILLVFVFLLASFPIQNSDFWLHLATGRYLIQDVTKVGVDPFSYVTEGVLWVNHSWLYDLIVYGIYQLTHGMLNGGILVVIKALVVAATAFVLLRIRRNREELFLSVVFVAISMVALSTRIWFQPSTVSLLFLALTMLILLKPSWEEDRPPSSRRFWLLVPLFALWVNIDEWFVLGPMMVALVLVGDALDYVLSAARSDDTRKQGQGRLRTLALVFVCGLLACLVNPYLYQAFSLPMELAYLVHGAVPGLPEGTVRAGVTLHEIEKVDPSFLRYFRFWDSPLVPANWRGNAGAMNIPGIGYSLLLLTGIGSFVAVLITGGDLRKSGSIWSRLLVWLAFFGISAAMGRLIFLFALVAGPIAALNFQDFIATMAARRKEARQPHRGLVLLPRFACLLILVALGLLVWPGWIRGTFGASDSFYRVGWAVEADPLLRDGALKLGELHEQGLLNNGFNLHPDIVGYAAWYSPHTKHFLDYRMGLFSKNAGTFGKIRQAFRLEAVPSTAESKKDLEEYARVRDEEFRKHNVTHLVITSTRSDVMNLVISQHLLYRPSQWTLIDGDAEKVIFRWWPEPRTHRDPQRQKLAIDFAELAFGSNPLQVNLDKTTIQFPQPSDLLQSYLVETTVNSADARRAEFISQTQETMTQHWKNTYTRLFLPAFQSVDFVGYLAGVSVSAPGGAAGFGAPSAMYLSIYPQIVSQSYVFQPNDLSPPGAAIFAVRLARQAVENNPNDPAAYRALASALKRLLQLEENFWANFPGPTSEVFRMEMRKELRQAELITALVQASILDPTDFQTEWELAQIFLDMHYLDLGLEHLIRARDLLAVRPVNVSNAELIKQQKDHIESIHQALSKAVKERTDYYRVHSQGLSLEEKYVLARRSPYKQIDEANKQKIDQQGAGLAGEGLKLLMSVDLKYLLEKGKGPLLIERLRLLANTGQTRQLDEDLSRLAEQGQLDPVLLLIQANLAAAMGAYGVVNQNLERLQIPVELAYSNTLYMIMLPTEAIGMNNPFGVFGTVRLRDLKQRESLFEIKLKFAELRQLRGLMYLEAGDIDKAAQQFQEVMNMFQGFVLPSELNISKHYLRQIKAVRGES